MTPELADLARRAMALEGAPRFWGVGARLADTTISCGTLDCSAPPMVWDLADRSPAGWALGGVLLGALGEDRTFIDHSCGGPYFFRSNLKTWRCATLSEACCRVAIAIGRWPGTI